MSIINKIDEDIKETSQLCYPSMNQVNTMTSSRVPKIRADSWPFNKEDELIKLDVAEKTLPGCPRVSLENSTQLTAFLLDELRSKDLDDMAPKLWMLSTRSGSNINPLHYQKVKGRSIIVTENPKLHLVWMYDRIFIKPLPKYLLSHDFWSRYILDENSPLRDQRRSVGEAALGLLRSYYYLISHESDFALACRDEARLIPSGATWLQFCSFSSQLKDIEDDHVSERYHYGELRLTRLNLYAKLLLRKFQYEQVHQQYGAYFSRFYGPILFIFAVWSLFLSAMQVELGVEAVNTSSWEAFYGVCRWFSVLTLVGLVFLSVLLVSLLLGMIADEWIFTFRNIRAKKRNTRNSEKQRIVTGNNA